MPHANNSTSTAPPPPPPGSVPPSTATYTSLPLVHSFTQQPREPAAGGCLNYKCRRRTSLERILLLLLFIVTLLATIFIVAIVTKPSYFINTTTSHTGAITYGTNGQELCMTQDCIKAASRIMSTMAEETDPCDDFFEYACGTWNRAHVIPDDRSNFDTFSNLRDTLQVVLKGLLEAPISSTDPYAITLAKNMYTSCVNTSIIESRGDAPLRQLLARLGGWPILDADWDGSTFDLEKLMSSLRLLNNRVLFSDWVSSDDRNSSVNVLQMDQPQLGMISRNYFLRDRDDDQLMAYQTFATDVAWELEADRDRATREVEEMVNFEIKLANITTPDEERRDNEAIYNKMTISDLYELNDRVDWLRYFNLLFENVSMTLERSEPVVVYASDFIHRLGVLLNETPNRTIANYMIWRIVKNRVSNLPQRFLDLHIKFNKAMYGVATHRPTWRICAMMTNENFGMAVGRMFVQNYFDENAKSVALEMIGNIRTAFINLLSEVDWMDDSTRTVAKQKADAIQEMIGYPDYILNDTAISKDYEGVVMMRDKYFENVVSLLYFTSQANLRNLREPFDKSKWSSTPAVVNAFYHGAKNQIIFPAAIFQPPFYHKNYPKFMNYGNIGMVIGHEITHGFDDTGRQFDKDGNLRQWWSESVIEKFKERAECIVEQYGNFTIPEVGLNLNGRNTQGENIADNGGLKQAYTAYRRWVEERGSEEPGLPGLDLNNDQLFFLNFAQIWCGIARKESYIRSVRSGRHSPGRFRVIGPLSNSYEFARAFQCPTGSRMNPEHKCKVW